MTTPGEHTTPDTAMASGSDAGEAGEHRDSVPLTAEEQAMLTALEQPDDAPARPAVEDSPAAAAAAAAEGPLPVEGGAGAGDDGDGLSAEFTDR